LTRDPLGYVDGMNMLGYVKSNIINFIDNYGLKKESCGDKKFKLETQCCIDGNVVNEKPCIVNIFIAHNFMITKLLMHLPKGENTNIKKISVASCKTKEANNRILEHEKLSKYAIVSDKRSNGYTYPNNYKYVNIGEDKFRKEPLDRKAGDFTMEEVLKLEIALMFNEIEKLKDISKSGICCEKIIFELIGFDQKGETWLQENIKLLKEFGFSTGSNTPRRKDIDVKKTMENRFYNSKK